MNHPNVRRGRAVRPARTPRILQGLVLGNMNVGLITRLLFGSTGMPLMWADEIQMARMSIAGNVDTGAFSLAERLLVQQTHKGRGWLYFDWYGDTELCERLAGEAQRAGRESAFFVLALDDPQHSAAWRVRPHGTCHEQALCLVELGAQDVESHDAAAERAYAVYGLTVLLEALRNDPWYPNRTLDDLAEIMTSDRAMDLIAARVVKDLPLGATTPTSDVFDDLVNLLAPHAPDLDSVKQALDSTAARIAQFVHGAYGPILNATESAVDLAGILTREKMLYVRLPEVAQDLEAMGLARMLVRDLQFAIEDRLHIHDREKLPFLAILDGLTLFSHTLVSQLLARTRPACVALVAMLPGKRSNQETSPVRDLLFSNSFTRVAFVDERRFVVEDGRKSRTGTLPD